MNRRTLLKAVASSALLSPVVASAGARYQPDHEAYEVTNTDIVLAGIPHEHDGLRIAQISDIHVGRNTPDGRIISAVRHINELKPDLVFLTGDYVTRKGDPLERVAVVLKNIDAPTFVVMGNHDHVTDVEYLSEDFSKLGYAVLRNQHSVVRARGKDLTILGIDDAVTKHDDVAETFKNAAQSGTRLVLAHSPPTIDKLPGDANVACFSGHTHGGHFVIPGVTESIFRKAGQPYVRGLHKVNSNQVYVNRGLGFGRGGPVTRMGADPELSVFTLRRG